MMLKGMATVSFFADDVDAAREWYSKLLGIQPYDEQILEFRSGSILGE